MPLSDFLTHERVSLYGQLLYSIDLMQWVVNHPRTFHQGFTGYIEAFFHRTFDWWEQDLHHLPNWVKRISTARH